MAMISGKPAVDAIRAVINKFVGIRNIRIADGLTLGQAIDDLAATYEATELAQKMQEFVTASGKGTVLTIRLGTELEYEMDIARPGKPSLTVGDNSFAGLIEQAIDMIKQDTPKNKKAKKSKESEPETLL